MSSFAKQARAGLVLTSILAATSIASADPTAQTFVEQAGASGQSVVFQDDPLGAGGLDPNDARIAVRPTGMRTFLLRPRSQFVMEMIKSVENL